MSDSKISELEYKGNKMKGITTEEILVLKSISILLIYKEETMKEFLDDESMKQFKDTRNVLDSVIEKLEESINERNK